VTCRGGGRSSRAVAWLTQQGYDVANLDGGMLAWQAAGKPMVADGDAAPDVK
jgi:rhodanese-related sulfurtransferase